MKRVALIGRVLLTTGVILGFGATLGGMLGLPGATATGTFNLGFVLGALGLVLMLPATASEVSSKYSPAGLVIAVAGLVVVSGPLVAKLLPNWRDAKLEMLWWIGGGLFLVGVLIDRWLHARARDTGN
jgi:uncharacterized protein YjeT (DUF2065 family)